MTFKAPQQTAAESSPCAFSKRQQAMLYTDSKQEYIHSCKQQEVQQAAAAAHAATCT